MIGMSKLKFYSIGIVAENKALDTRTVEVAPIETLPYLNGEITDHAEKYDAKGKDRDGQAYQESIDTTISVSANWLPMHNSNRFTPPDVRRGEVVTLYQFGDSDEFWWTTLRDDHHLRKLETVIYGWSGTREEGAKPDETNTYFLEVSTHKKIIHLHTSKADGEPFIYDIQINTGEGFIQIMDDIGNFIKLDSAEREVTLANSDGSFLSLNKEIINMHSEDTINISTKNINVKSTNHHIMTENLTKDSVNHVENTTNRTTTNEVEKHTTSERYSEQRKLYESIVETYRETINDYKGTFDSFLRNTTSSYTQVGSTTVRGDILHVGQLTTGGFAVTGMGGSGGGSMVGNMQINGNTTINGTITSPNGVWHLH